MKKIKVQLEVWVRSEDDVAAIKEWEHHIDRAIDLDSYPEIDHIENVVVKEVCANGKTSS